MTGSLFPQTIREYLAGTKVECSFLFAFEFASDTVRLWAETGRLDTNDGESWFGIGSFGEASGIEQAVNGEAPEATFTLSALDQDIFLKCRDEWDSEGRGRWVRAYLQFYGVDDAADPHNQRPLDLPYPIAAFRMLRPNFAFTQEGERSVAISAETIFALRSRPRHAMYTDADQQARFPGDRGFEFVGLLAGGITTTWPDF